MSLARCAFRMGPMKVAWGLKVLVPWKFLGNRLVWVFFSTLVGSLLFWKCQVTSYFYCYRIGRLARILHRVKGDIMLFFPSFYPNPSLSWLVWKASLAKMKRDISFLSILTPNGCFCCYEFLNLFISKGETPPQLHSVLILLFIAHESTLHRKKVFVFLCLLS